MFPIAPQVLNQSTSSASLRFPMHKSDSSSAIWNIWTDSLSIRRTAIQRKCSGAFAQCSLAEEMKSSEFSEIETCNRKDQLLISVNSSGNLSANYDEKFWIRKINISQDTYSNAALLEITNRQKFRVRIVKNVRPNEEITLWFSENALAEMNVPFLSPSNILGNSEKRGSHRSVSFGEGTNFL